MRRPLSWVWAASALYALLYAALGWDRYATYHSGSDVGLFTQTLASAWHGFSNTTEGGSHFRVHFSPFLFVCAPAVMLTHSSLTLVAVQACAGALTAPPLFLLARKRMPQAFAAGVAGIALLYPPLAGVIFADFHENGFVPALTLWLLWAFDARRFAMAALFAALLLGVKEDQATILGFSAVVGIVWYARADRARLLFAMGVLAASVAVFVGFFDVVRPLAGATDVWGPTHFYTWSRIVDPRGSAPWWSIGRPAYFLEALVPLALVPLLSPAFVLALPGFVEVLASHESITYTMGQHYAAIWIPYVLYAFALALARVRECRPRVGRGLLRTSLVLCVAVLVFASPTHWGHYLRAPDRNDHALDAVLAALPHDASIGAPDEIYAHLGFDPDASLGLGQAPSLAIVDARHTDSALGLTMRAQLRAGRARSGYRLVSSLDGIELYIRRGRTSTVASGGAAARGAEHAPNERGSDASRAGAQYRQVIDGGRRNQ